MILAAGILHSEPHPLWDSRRLWSLWDMINFQLGHFLRCLDFLEYELRNLNGSPRDEAVPEAQHARIKNNIDGAIQPEIAKLFSETTRLASIDVEDILQRYSRRKYTYGEMAAALGRLRRDFLESASHEYFFHYPKEMAKLLFNVSIEWKEAITAFSGAKVEIEAGVDCYALSDYPGCIFHMTRTAELALRVIARELKVKTVRSNKPIEYAMWGEIIGALQKAVDDLRAAKGNTKTLMIAQRQKRECRIERYSAILSDIQAILPLRDRNSHYRDKYDRGEAFSAMHRVREIMTLTAQGN